MVFGEREKEREREERERERERERENGDSETVKMGGEVPFILRKCPENIIRNAYRCFRII